jgi:hypothetical protein
MFAVKEVLSIVRCRWISRQAEVRNPTLVISFSSQKEALASFEREDSSDLGA